eukprot:3248656-Amphidinium_carterae.1
MKLESDRKGVPQYSGQPEQWQKYVKATGNCLGISVQSHTHTHAELTTRDSEKKTTPAGLELLLSILESAIAKEKPLRVQERFEWVFFVQSARRASRRLREMKELTDISPQTTVSSDAQAQLLLRFSGLSPVQRSQAIAAAGNKMYFDSIEQLAEVHLLQGRPAPRTASTYTDARCMRSKPPTRKVANGMARTGQSDTAALEDYDPDWMAETNDGLF